MNYSDRVIITLDHTHGSRHVLTDYLLKNGAKAVISCIEYHGGTKEKMKERIADPNDELTEDNCHHLCAVAFGRFHKKNMTNRGRRYFQKKFDKLDQHFSVLYCHVNTSKKGNVSYSSWPLEDMVEYVTEHTEKKDVDETPLIAYEGTPPEDNTPFSFVERYNEFTNVFKKVRKMKETNVPVSDVIETVYDQLDSRDKLQTNIFMQYYHNIKTELPRLNPEDLVLKKWQKQVITWAKAPMVRDEPPGLWLNLRPGAGKTVLLNQLIDDLGWDNIYSLSHRPGDFDAASMMDYNNQPLILINELEIHKDDEGKSQVTKSLAFILKAMCDRHPIQVKFGNKTTLVVPQAKVIVTSNSPRPIAIDQAGCPFARRFIELNSSDFGEEDMPKIYDLEREQRDKRKFLEISIDESHQK